MVNNNYPNIFKDLSWLGTQRIIQRLLGLANLYLIVRHFPIETFGYYQFIFVALNIISIFSLPGLDNAIMQAVSRDLVPPFRKAAKAALAGACLGSIALIAATMALSKFRPTDFAPLAAAAILSIPYFGLTQWKSLLLGKSQFNKLSYLEILTTFITSSTIIISIYCEIENLSVFVALIMIPTASMNIFATIIYSPRENLTHNLAADSIYGYGISTSLVTSVSLLAENIERLILFIVMGPATLASYMAGDRLSELVRSVFQDAAAVLAPRFARMSAYSGDLERLILKICTFFGILILIFALTLAPTILMLIFGKSYEQSIPYAQALLCSVAVGNVGQFQFRYIRSQLDATSFRLITFWTSGIRIVASVILVSTLGAWGAIAVIFIHRLSLSFITSAIIRRKYDT